MNPLDDFPYEWRSDVVVLRGGGRDAKGNPMPVAEIARPGVMLVPRSTTEAVDRADTTVDLAVLHDGDASFSYLSTDRIRVQAGMRMAGTWAVDGRPSEWPYGSEVALKGT